LPQTDYCTSAAHAPDVIGNINVQVDPSQLSRTRSSLATSFCQNFPDRQKAAIPVKAHAAIAQR